MSELRIVRGTDVTLYVDTTPLFGVTSFSAVEKKSTYDIYEYLSTEPCERIPQRSSYEIKLSIMALFSDQLPTENGYELRVADGDTEYIYENCRLKEQKTELKGNEKAVEVLILEADRMRKAVTEHE